MAGRAQALCRHRRPKQAHGARRRGAAAGRAVGLPLDGPRRAAHRRRATTSTGTASTRPSRPIRDWLVPLEIALIYLYHKHPSKAPAPRPPGRRKGARRASMPGTSRASASRRWASTARPRASFERCLELSPRHVEAEPAARRARQSGLVDLVANEAATAIDRPPARRNPTIRISSHVVIDRRTVDVLDARQDSEGRAQAGRQRRAPDPRHRAGLPRQRRDPPDRGRAARRSDAARHDRRPA